MVSALDSRATGPDLSPGWGHCVVFLGNPYKNNAYFISILFLFYMLFYSYHFCIFSLFSGLF